MKMRRPLPLLLTGAALLVGCDREAVAPEATGPRPSSISAAALAETRAAAAVAYLAELNAQLAAVGAGYEVHHLEWQVDGGVEAENPNIVFANNRTLRLASRWVPGDPRRLADGNRITQLSFGPLMTANGSLDAEPAIDASFSTWNALQCTGLRIEKRATPAGEFPSAILRFPGLRNNPFAADISTIGFLSGALFDAVLGPGASRRVLGVTFTFVFGTRLPDGSFVPSDVDGDGRRDTALKEIWYNNAFRWTLTGSGGIDVETVALHENGHAMELGHFGRLSFNTLTGAIQASPRAVMNASYLGPFRAPAGTDNASYCSNFAEWP